MINEKYLKDYENFVVEKLSNENKNTLCLIERLNSLQKEYEYINISSLIGSCMGLSGEIGELVDIVKKIIMQGKKLDDKTKENITKEAGDIFFYYIMLLNSMNLSLYEIIEKNKEKLNKRYENKGFDINLSENRKE